LSSKCESAKFLRRHEFSFQSSENRYSKSTDKSSASFSQWTPEPFPIRHYGTPLALDNELHFHQSPFVEQPPVIQTPSAAPRKKKRGKLIAFLIVLGILIAAAFVAALKNKPPPVTVQTEKVARRNITEIVVASGKIQPVTEVHISPEVSGEITELAVKEGQRVKKGDLLLKIKPDLYIAGTNQANASYKSSIAGQATAQASLEKAEADYQRNKELFDSKLLSESDYIGFKTALDIARAQVESAADQVAMAKAAVASAQDSLDKTTIYSPLDGTISELNSQLGERVLGTAQNEGTAIMTIADLDSMEARVNIGEMDVVLIQPGQNARLDVDSFRDKKFTGIVTAISNSSGDSSSKTSAGSSSSSSSSQDATQFQVRIRVSDKEFFRPGMSVTAEIETRYRTNVISVPIASVTTRLIKATAAANVDPPKTNSAVTNSIATTGSETNSTASGPTEVVFVVDGDHVNAVPVKIGISDDNYWEVTDGLREGDEIVSGGYRAISRDLDDGKKIRKGVGAE
jgi:HlyD family secretion protein